ncbi:hypothetical protein FRC01_007289, partial [Tulasnella sp. 417]
MQPPSCVLSINPSAPQLDEYLKGISSEQTPDPEIKSYPDAVYFNFYSLGLSLLFVPING